MTDPLTAAERVALLDLRQQAQLRTWINLAGTRAYPVNIEDAATWAYITRLINQHRAYEATVQALDTERATLRAALRPLAALHTAIPLEWADDRPIYIRNDRVLTVGDVRRARALLTEAAP